MRALWERAPALGHHRSGRAGRDRRRPRAAQRTDRGRAPPVRRLPQVASPAPGRRRRPGPSDYGLALLVDASAYPPEIGAIHRVIPGLAPAAAADLAKAAFTVRRLPGGTPHPPPPARLPIPPSPALSTPASLPAALEELAQANRHGPAFLLAGGSDFWLLTDPDPVQVDAAMPPGHSPRWRALAASVLQELLIARIWGISDSEPDVRIVHNDAGEAIAEADEAGGTAVICPSMSAWDVYDVAARGERVPRKSTSFGPKPRTGLVIRTFAQG